MASPEDPNDEGDEAWTITATESVEPVRLALEAWWDRAETAGAGFAMLDWVKVNAIGSEGQYLDEGITNEYRVPQGTNNAGSSGGVDWPQITTVVSWRTEVQRGLAARGRIYVPTVTGKDASTGRIPTTYTEGMAESAAELLADLNDIPQLLIGGSLVASVVSRGRPTGPGTYGPGIARPITRVEVGNVQDTQRRRRNDLPEVYSGVDL